MNHGERVCQDTSGAEAWSAAFLFLLNSILSSPLSCYAQACTSEANPLSGGAVGGRSFIASFIFSDSHSTSLPTGANRWFLFLQLIPSQKKKNKKKKSIFLILVLAMTRACQECHKNQISDWRRRETSKRRNFLFLLRFDASLLPQSQVKSTWLIFISTPEPLLFSLVIWPKGTPLPPKSTPISNIAASAI